MQDATMEEDKVDGGEQLTPEQVQEAAVKTAEERAQKLEAEIAMLKEQVNPNWQVAHKKIKNLEAALKNQGKDIDEQGNVVDKTQLTVQEIEERGRMAARSELLEARRSELLEEYDEETREEVEKYFTKLTTGEQITLKNVKSFIQQAAAAAGAVNPANVAMRALASGQGRPPRQVEKKDLEDDKADELAAQLGISIKQPKA